MSVKILVEVLDNAPAKGGELIYLIALADQAGDDDRCAWPGVKTLMRRSRAGRSTIYEYAENAQRKQIIERCPEDEMPLRYRRRPGRETVVWRFRPVEDWLEEPLDVMAPEGSEDVGRAPEGTRGERGVQNLDGSSPPDPRGPAHRTRTTTEETPSPRRTTTTPSSLSSSPSRRATRGRARDMQDPVDQIDFGTVTESGEEEVVRSRTKARQHGPDSVWSLNGYYRDQVMAAGNGRLGNTNDQAIRKFFSEARKTGVHPETLRAMVDVFVSDERLFDRTKTERWKTFIANARTLQVRAERSLGVRRLRDDTTVEQESYGAIPQHILDEVMKEA